MNEASPPPVPAVPKNAPGAIWSLVLGILGLVCFGLITGIPAVICGHTAQSKIRRSSGALTGEGLALGGLITGYISIGLSVLMIPILLAIAIPNFVKAREIAQRNACINNLRQLDGAKQQWALENKKPDDAVPTFLELDSYVKGAFNGMKSPAGESPTVDAVNERSTWKGAFSNMKCPAGGSYIMNAVNERPTCSVRGHELPD